MLAVLFFTESCIAFLIVDLTNYEFDQRDLICLGGCTIFGVWYLWKRVIELFIWFSIEFLQLNLFTIKPGINYIGIFWFSFFELFWFSVVLLIMQCLFQFMWRARDPNRISWLLMHYLLISASHLTYPVYLYLALDCKQFVWIGICSEWGWVSTVESYQHWMYSTWWLVCVWHILG